MSDPALSFGSVAQEYDRGRPGYPAQAVAWLLDSRTTNPSTSFVSVLEVGAGTGKLTREAVATGAHVFATDPDDAMLDVLASHLPDIRATRARAEELPVPDQSVDVVIAGQSFHWIDPIEGVTEMARVLKPGGHIGIIRNQRDETIPWVRKFGKIINGALGADTLKDPTEILEADGYFAGTAHATFTFWQEVDRETLVELALSHSSQINAPEAIRADTRARVEALYDDYGRGTGGMRVPYICHAWRAKVTEKRAFTPPPAPVPTTLLTSEYNPMTDTAVALPRVLDGYGFENQGTDEVKLFTWH